MTIQQIIFILISGFTLIAALVVVLDRNLFRAAVALMASFLGVAGIYIMLDAGFMAVAQLLVYIGAISILVIFAIMMTRRLMQTSETPFNSQPLWGFLAALLAFAMLAVILVSTWPSSDYPGAPPAGPGVLRGGIDAIGQLLVSPDAYVLPFEVASVLLLAALVGAIVIARPEKES